MEGKSLPKLEKKKNEFDGGINLCVVFDSNAHSRCVNSVLYFPPSLVVSGSDDQHVVFWDLENDKICGQDDVGMGINQLLKISSDKFIAAVEDGSIFLYNAKSKKRERVVRKFDQCGAVSRILMIGNNTIFVALGDNVSHVLKLSTGEILRSIKTPAIRWHTRAILSKKYEKCLYLCVCKADLNELLPSFDDEEEGKKHNMNNYEVLLINHEKCKILRCLHPDSKAITISFETFIDRMEEEILMIGGFECVIYFYHTRTRECLRRIRCSEKISFIQRLGTKFLLVADFDGILRIYDLYNNEDNTDFVHKQLSSSDEEKAVPGVARVMFSELLHSKGHATYDIIQIHDEDESGSPYLKLISCSHDRSVRVSEIRGLGNLRITDRLKIQEMEDLGERVQFLREFSAEKIFFSEEDRNILTIKFSASFVQICEILKILMI